MTTKSVIVIGAGIGGIAVAARLAQQGYDVTVVEKNEQPGGRCGALEKDGHHFVSGPTLFLMPELYQQTFADLGEEMSDHLDLRRIDPTYHIHFHDGFSMTLTSDLLKMKHQLEAIEPGSFGRYLSYLNEGYRSYKLSLPHLLMRNFRNIFEFLTPQNLAVILRIRAFSKHQNRIARYFDDERLKAAFTFQDMYVGLSPYQAPALFSLLQYSELANGVWFPMGGMSRVAETLVDIAQSKGVRFLYNTAVERIRVANRRASGVTLVDGRDLSADIVVANADLPYVYRKLLPDDGSAKRLENNRYSCSVMMFCWGVDKQYPQLHTHHLFFAEDIRADYRTVTEKHSVSEYPSFYLHAPRVADPSVAPKGQDTLTVLVPMGHLDASNPKDWPALRNQMRRAVLRKLAGIGLDDLESHIKFEMCFNPHDWQDRFNLEKGASHGLSHNLMQMAYFRPHNRHRRYRNLYFVGASTHPGTGVPVVLVSARLTAERILQEAPLAKAEVWANPLTATIKRLSFQ